MGALTKSLFLFALALVATGCATSPISPVQTTQTVLISHPPIGEEVTANLGETLAEEGIRAMGLALSITRATTFNKAAGDSSVWTCGLTVPPGQFFESGRYEKTSREDETLKIAACFGPMPVSLTTADGTSNWNCMGNFLGHVCQDSQTKEYFLNAGGPLFEDYPLEQGFENLDVSPRVAQWDTNFMQEFIYNGRVGDSLRFVYRELVDDMIRPSFSQEVQYDLSESNIIGFKGLRIEVLDATNTELRYRLLSNFQ